MRKKGKPLDFSKTGGSLIVETALDSWGVGSNPFKLCRCSLQEFSLQAILMWRIIWLPQLRFSERNGT